MTPLPPSTRRIAADPTKALAYYWKGINLIGKATVGKDNKMTAPDGTAEAFQKYLELDPERLDGANRQGYARPPSARPSKPASGQKKQPVKK